MAEDIWEEKPNSEDQKYIATHVDISSRGDRTYYDYLSPRFAEDMDVWLEKLKEEWDAILRHHVTQEKGYEKQIKELEEKAAKWDRLDQPAKYNLTKYMECSDKLEAVKVLVETAHSQGKMDYSTYSVFKKILEAEG